MNAHRHLIAALSEDNHGGIATLQDVTRAEQLVGAYRVEVLREEMKNIRRIEREDTPEGAIGTRTGLLRAALILDERAEATEEKGTAEASPPASEFFRAGRTYQRRRWQFQCLAVAPNPFNGETRAVGFLYRPGEPATATALDADDWAHGGWTDVTEGGAG